MNSNGARKSTMVVLALTWLTSALCWTAPGATLNDPDSIVRYTHDAWTTENGLPQNSVTAILQTRDGYLWVGTLGGLVRFDGVRFTTFTTGNASGLKSDRILAIYEDRAGNLWIGTEFGGLTKYAGGRFSTYTKEDGLPDDQARTICEDQAGNLWIGTSKGLAKWSGGQFSTFTTADGLGNDFINRVQATRDGSLWVVTWPRGVTQLQSGGAKTFANTFANMDGHPLDWFIRGEDDGSFWFQTNRRIAKYTSGKVTAYTGELPRHLPFYSDNQGNLCYMLPTQLVRLEDGKSITYGANEFVPALDPARIHKVVEDREGNLWIGTGTSGLHRLRPAQCAFYAKEAGLSDGSFVPIRDDGEGGLLLGSVDGGLFRFRAGTFSHQNLPVAPWALQRDPEGTLWVGDVGGLHRVKDGRLITHNQANSRLSGWVSAIYRDREGNLWVGTRDGEGLYRFQNDELTPVLDQELIHQDVQYITQDRQGALWVCTVGGLSRLKDGVLTNYSTENGLPNNNVRAIHEDAEGVLWIGTYGGGLSRFKDGRFINITIQVGLFDNIVSRILEDDRGNFWMSCNRGIFHASRKELNDFADGKIGAITCVSYGVGDGMKTVECNGGGQPAGWKATDGRLWFPTIRGVVVVDPSSMNDVIPPVVVEEVTIDQNLFASRDLIEAPPGDGNLEIHYTALSLAAPEKLQFKYMLEGYDKSWVNAGARRVAYYTNIPPGSHRFRVIACNNDGLWNEAGAVLDLYLAPYFYQTGWFYGLCGLAVVLAAAGGLRWRVKHLLRRTQELESRVSERTAELVEQKNELTVAKQALERANDDLERANDDLLSIMNSLRVGVVMTDLNGRVLFVSEAAQQFLDATPADAVGKQWGALIPLLEQDISRISAMFELPPERRGRIPVRIKVESGRGYWMEIEVEDDPRDPSRKMLFLYDVSEVYDLRLLLDDKAHFQGLVGQSASMQIVFKQIRDLACVDATVLIEGETGTGKELVARGIHYSSHRKNKPFIAVNAAGLTESMLASQLFGHRRGAFTGAVSDHIGLFEAADGGTIFLDEIGDIPMSVQTSLLRVLQEKEITRLGESKPRRIDVRVVAATHRDLARLVEAGSFRQDLLYRIRVARVTLPPLRHRREDVPLLASWFIRQCSATGEESIKEISSETMDVLLRYDWPGNVRELRNAIESAVIGCDGHVVQPGHLPIEMLRYSHPQKAAGVAVQGGSRDERERILDALERAGGNRAAAARLLGIGRSTLYRKLESLGLTGDDY